MAKVHIEGSDGVPRRRDTSAIQKSAQAAVISRSSKRVKRKGHIGHIFAIGVFIGVTCLGLFLAWEGRKSRAISHGRSALDALVNDDSVIKAVNLEGTFAAAASEFFQGWTLADAKYGLDGVTITNLIGMPGAAHYCEVDESFASGIVPVNFDGRETWPGCIGAVYDSGNCSASYAIAAASSLSARFCIADGDKYRATRLSPQQVVSCDKKSQGCQGGGIDSVWAYIQRRGLYPEQCLAFKGQADAKCQTTCAESQKLKPISYCVMKNQVKSIKREILASGPVVVPLRLTREFLVYSGGIYTPTRQLTPLVGEDGKPLVHAVTIVGWGKSEASHYWLIQNCWGASWGEHGYARVAVNSSALLDSRIIVGVPETEENVAKAQEAKKRAQEKREQARKDRAERDARIAEKERLQREMKQKEDLDKLDDFLANAELNKKQKELDDLDAFLANKELNLDVGEDDAKPTAGDAGA
eukprot:TRINITY_DN32963_c0_g1_i1.p1 TRINITY_DN32963_c0_g1~~TRINITY_DN32963_c0_g1_i1.p1  ORF type:complete len:470 (+),score=92.12 TRINITY_DN32963_c0_g1_i1:30-1439(+)